MEFIYDNWELVERFGPPIAAACMLIVLITLFLYGIECKHLHDMEREIKDVGDLSRFRLKTYGFVNTYLIFFILKPIPNRNSKFLEHPRYQAQVKTVKGYRKFFAVVIPLLVTLVAIGIYINEQIMDK